MVREDPENAYTEEFAARLKNETVWRLGDLSG